jgi:hypothetical protein
MGVPMLGSGVVLMTSTLGASSSVAGFSARAGAARKLATTKAFPNSCFFCIFAHVLSLRRHYCSICTKEIIISCIIRE